MSCIDFNSDILKRNIKYLSELDCFGCAAGKHFEYVKLVYKKTTQNYYRLYRMPRAERKQCQFCAHRRQCAFSHSDCRINASAFYPAFHRNRQRYETPEYRAMKRLRGIWAEGAFAVSKREHNIARARKRGLHRVHEECLLSAMALNLKRMVKALDKGSSAPAGGGVSVIFGTFLRFFCSAVQWRLRNCDFVNRPIIIYIR